MAARVYILGGFQSDFALNWAREGLELMDGMRNVVFSGLQAARLEPTDIEVAHIGNFAGELFCNQGHLGGLFAALDPAFAGLPASRHEGACASGSLAALGAAAEIEAGRYQLAAVVGVEMMRNVSGSQAAQFIGAPAMWSGHEGLGVTHPWPHMFSDLTDRYEHRYGLRREHLVRIAEINFTNAKRNPNAQTRRWSFEERSFTEDDAANPVISGRIRRQDCGQISDGAAVVFLASAERAREYARHTGLDFERLPYIRGWGHRTAPITYQAKIETSHAQPLFFPHIRATVQDALKRAELAEAAQLDGIEVHDCFTCTEYLAIDHFGLTPAGESWRAIESGSIEFGGKLPINASGGLIGGGHPVGATGARMLLDSYKQVSGNAGDYQIEGARTVATLNIGGSLTTVVSFVVGR
jgi:acetyl-CoA C-acetyltransferase